MVDSHITNPEVVQAIEEAKKLPRKLISDYVCSVFGIEQRKLEEEKGICEYITNRVLGVISIVEKHLEALKEMPEK